MDLWTPPGSGLEAIFKTLRTVIASPTMVGGANSEATAQVKCDIAAFEARARAVTAEFAMG